MDQPRGGRFADKIPKVSIPDASPEHEDKTALVAFELIINKTNDLPELAKLRDTIGVVLFHTSTFRERACRLFDERAIFFFKSLLGKWQYLPISPEEMEHFRAIWTSFPFIYVESRNVVKDMIEGRYFV